MFLVNKNIMNISETTVISENQEEYEEYVDEVEENQEEEYTPVIFTRYLYILDDVKTSLMLSILNRNRDEALFWAYELYYSGYIDQVFELVTNIYNEFYSTLNPNLGLFLIKIKNIQKNSEYLIGTIIYNLIHRKYNISSFVEKYSKTPFNLVYPNCNENDKKFFIILEEKDIQKYRTIECSKPTTILSRAATYNSHSYSAKLFENDYIEVEREELLTMYRQDWLYYASFSPIWAERILKYKGNVDHEKKKICFENEDIEDAFYEKYYYDPDEQPSHIQFKSIGTGAETQWSWNDFYEKYK